MYRLFAKCRKSVPLVASIPAIIAGNDWYEYIRHNNTTKSHTNSSFKPSLTLRSVRLEDTPIDDQMRQVFDDCSKSVVRIILKNTGVGTGFIVDKSGLVVTNAHVVQDWEFVDVYFPIVVAGQLPFGMNALRGQVLYSDPNLDVAIVRVYPENPLSALKLFDSGEELSPGQPVLAIGNPPALPLGCSVGVVNSTDAPIGETGMTEQQVEHMAPIIPGYSGGPLLDRTGAVVAVNFAGRMDKGGMKYGCAIKSVDVLKVVNKVKENDFEINKRRKRFSMAGRKMLGVMLEQTDDGFVVTRLPISGLQTNGLQLDDRIVDIDDEPLETFTQLENAVQNAPEGGLKLTVARKDGVKTVLVKPVSGDYHDCSRL